MADDDLRDQIARIESDIEQLAQALESKGHCALEST